jgi:hypothetical protein
MSLHKPTPRVPIPQAIAGCTGFAAFAVASLVGGMSSNPLDVVLTRALIALLCGFVGGFLIGLICGWIVDQEVARIESVVEEETKAIEAGVAGRNALEGVEVLDEEALGVVEERAARRRLPIDGEDDLDSGMNEEKNAA